MVLIIDLKKVVKVVNNSEVLTFLWAFHRRGLYDNGVGILPSGVVEPSARSVIDFDNTTEEFPTQSAIGLPSVPTALLLKPHHVIYRSKGLPQWKVQLYCDI
eukprot:4536132-Amphidinium_carterae.1